MNRNFGRCPGLALFETWDSTRVPAKVKPSLPMPYYLCFYASISIF
jgi:hypothetical protein